MERTGEATQREHEAHKLELSALKIEDGRVRGEVKGFQVTLEGDAPFHTCQIDLSSPLPIAKLAMVHGDLNHPDAVETGDPHFDEVMQVLAQPGLAPTALKILSEPGLRGAVLELLRRHPDSELGGRTLTLRSKEPLTHALVLEAVEVARRLTARFAELGFVETEERPRLPGEVRSPEEIRRLRANIIGISLTSTVLVFGITAFFDAPATVTAAIVGVAALVAAVRVWSVGR